MPTTEAPTPAPPAARPARPALSPRRVGGRLWIAVLCGATLCGAAMSVRPLWAQELAPRQATESPYFLVPGGDAAIDRLPLKKTEVDVRISGVIADVTVTQHYRNEGSRAIEARYVFPGSTRAAVSGLNVRLADRLVTAQIREKQQARIEYQVAQAAGKTAALLEQKLPNVFQMNVANILPGDDVRVELRYSELLVPQGGNYEFVFPTVVGPRYNSPQSENAAARWVAQPFLPNGVPPAGDFALKVALDTPLALQEVRSRTHAIEVRKDGRDARHATVALAAGSGPAHDRDFVLDYRLAGDAIASGLMLHQAQGGPGGGENFFLALVEPPKAVAATAISPRDYVFVVDISGSMHGFPLDTTKQVLERLIGGLRPSDTFNVLLFSGSNKALSPHSVPATRANIDRALATIGDARAGGSTELIPALRRVYDEPKAADVSRTVVVVTDGYVTVEREAFELVRRNLSKANLFTFGIGSSVNRHLMEGLARAGRGEPFVITDPAQAPEQAARFRRMVESPVLTSVRARFEGLDVYDVEPAVLPDVLGERPVVVFGKWRGTPTGRMVVEGHSASGPYRQEVAVDGAARHDTPALRTLWARHRIAALSDQEALEGGDAHAKPITALGLQYGLLTQYTSFIAVDQVVRNLAPRDADSVDHPSPLPKGVGEQAIGQSVGAEVPSTPEPAAFGAVAVVLSVLCMLQRRSRRRGGRHAERFTA